MEEEEEEEEGEEEEEEVTERASPSLLLQYVFYSLQCTTTCIYTIN